MNRILADAITIDSPDNLAKIIFDWLDRVPKDRNDHHPYTYLEDGHRLLIGVDGEIDCTKMAEGIVHALRHQDTS